jgi:hypothetical protein
MKTNDGELLETIYYDAVFDEILIFVTSARMLSKLDFKSKRYAVLEFVLITDEIYHKTFEDLYYESEIVNNRLKKEIQKLKADREVLLKCVEFYARAESWEDGGDIDYTHDRIGYDDTDVPEQCCDKRGGRLARATLKSIGEIE